MTPDFVEAIVVLGCRLEWDGAGRLVGAGGRRVEAAAALVRELGARGRGPRIVASGGRAWDGVFEADAMGEELARRGVDPMRIDRERGSRSTRENARNTRALLGPLRAAVVTCDWHLPRALALFRAEGFEVCGVPAPSGSARWTRRLYRWGRERVARALDRL
jgi:uncharacterized SAM-binding protein YcdF (DUF218 family)